MEESWFSAFFTPYYLIVLIMGLTALGVMIFSISLMARKGRTRVRIITCVYLLAVVLQVASLPIIFRPYFEEYIETIQSAGLALFANIEFLCLGLVLHSILLSAKIKRVLLWLILGTSIIGSIYLFQPPLTSGKHFHFSVFASFFNICVCFIYFYELFLRPTTKSLATYSSFWLATGIFTYLVCIIPNFLVFQFVPLNESQRLNNLSMITFFASILLYVSFIKALTCKTYPTTSSSL